jgi:hypothetical protein
MDFTDLWADLNDAVLNVFTAAALTTGDVQRALPDVPADYVRTALHLNAERGYLRASVGAVRTGYTLTEAGKRHLADTMKVA